LLLKLLEGYHQMWLRKQYLELKEDEGEEKHHRRLIFYGKKSYLKR
jgi:hypothetical protein